MKHLKYIRNNAKSVAKVICFEYVAKIFCNLDKENHERRLLQRFK